jgi:hypothetical protein
LECMAYKAIPQKAQIHNRRCDFTGTLIEPHPGRFRGVQGGQILTGFSTQGGQARATRHEAGSRPPREGVTADRRIDGSMTAGISSRAQIQSECGFQS